MSVENLQSQKRLLTAELNDAVNRGNIGRRNFILDRLSEIDRQIRSSKSIKKQKSKEELFIIQEKIDERVQNERNYN